MSVIRAPNGEEITVLAAGDVAGLACERHPAEPFRLDSQCHPRKPTRALVMDHQNERPIVVLVCARCERPVTAFYVGELPWYDARAGEPDPLPPDHP